MNWTDKSRFFAPSALHFQKIQYIEWFWVWVDWTDRSFFLLFVDVNVVVFVFVLECPRRFFTHFIWMNMNMLNKFQLIFSGSIVANFVCFQFIFPFLLSLVSSEASTAQHLLSKNSTVHFCCKLILDSDTPQPRNHWWWCNFYFYLLPFCYF